MHSSTLIFILILAYSELLTVNCYQYEENEAKRILDPKELINYTRRQKLGKRVLLRRQNKNIQTTFTTKEYSTEETINTDEEDKEALDIRKIWSRWGKWSPCSVTCGNGVITRRRLCVTGRCAPGELEEQRRPCSRAPCFVSSEPGQILLDPD